MNWDGTPGCGSCTAAVSRSRSGLTVGISTVILGGLIGILAGYVGGVLDNALMRLVDMIYTIPRIVLVAGAF